MEVAKAEDLAEGSGEEKEEAKAGVKVVDLEVAKAGEKAGEKVGEKEGEKAEEAGGERGEWVVGLSIQNLSHTHIRPPQKGPQIHKNGPQIEWASNGPQWAPNGPQVKWAPNDSQWAPSGPQTTWAPNRTQGPKRTPNGPQGPKPQHLGEAPICG